jgi:putative addiction module component (TIGR02574 family)
MKTHSHRLDKTAMTTSAQEIAQKALQLSEEDRHYVIEVLNNSFSRDVDPEIEKAWEEEIERRVRDIDEGKVELIPMDDVLRDMKRWINEAADRKNPGEGTGGS